MHVHLMSCAECKREGDTECQQVWDARSRAKHSLKFFKFIPVSTKRWADEDCPNETQSCARPGH